MRPRRRGTARAYPTGVFFDVDPRVACHAGPGQPHLPPSQLNSSETERASAPSGGSQYCAAARRVRKSPMEFKGHGNWSKWLLLNGSRVLE